MNQKGRIWRAVSTVGGMDGVGGPYRNVGIVLQPGPESEPWEGFQDMDFFFPYRVGKEWYAFYGSAKTQSCRFESWRVGMASAPSVAGSWRRRSELRRRRRHVHGVLHWLRAGVGLARLMEAKPINTFAIGSRVRLVR